jgi:hypothetical protein
MVLSQNEMFQKEDKTMRISRLGSIVAIAIVAICNNGSARAQNPFTIQLTVPGSPVVTEGFTGVDNAINSISNQANLTRLAPTYTDPASAAQFAINLRGLTGTLTYPVGSTALVVYIPGGGINQTFDSGTSRADSVELFRRCVEQGVCGNVFHGLANTAADPFAGNPNSLMNQMVAGDFGHAVANATGASQPGASVDARFGSFSGAGLTSNNIALPLGYSWRLSERDGLDLDVPLSFTDTNGAKSYSGNVGVLWRHRILTNWTLQPSVRFGGVGSVDLGSAAGAWSVGLNSTLKFDLPASWQLVVANGITYISSVPVSVGKYTVDYKLSNTVFRNGLIATHDLGFKLANLPMRGSLFIIDTRFTGDAVYTSSYQEFGVFAASGSLTPINSARPTCWARTVLMASL